MAPKKSVARKTPPPSTRYAQVMKILSASAQGGRGPGDVPPFWDLDLAQFKDASIYGVRLIAPEQAPDRA